MVFAALDLEIGEIPAPPETARFEPVHQLDRVLDGDIDAMVDALITRRESEALQAAG